MNNQQLIKQIEQKIKETRGEIESWKTQIAHYESTVLSLTQQLKKIKNQINITKK